MTCQAGSGLATRTEDAASSFPLCRRLGRSYRAGRSVAIDAQSHDRPRLYVERAGVRFTTLVDQANILSDLYGFKAIPNGFLIDEQGTVRFSQLGGFDIGRRETAEILERWVSGQSEALTGEAPAGVLDTRHSESNAVFREGLELYESGRIGEALTRWRQGLELNPDNYLIRKQIWAVENPERFYEGDVDYAWQREQTAKGL